MLARIEIQKDSVLQHQSYSQGTVTSQFWALQQSDKSFEILFKVCVPKGMLETPRTDGTRLSSLMKPKCNFFTSAQSGNKIFVYNQWKLKTANRCKNTISKVKHGGGSFMLNVALGSLIASLTNVHQPESQLCICFSNGFNNDLWDEICLQFVIV